MLLEPLRPPVGLAYLLARAADTISDTRAVPSVSRLKHLLAFRAQVAGPSSEVALERITGDLVSSRTSLAEAELLRSLPLLFARLEETDDADAGRIRSVVTTLTEGMEMDLTTFPSEDSGQMAALPDLEATDRYIYLVAGCVGHFWTEISAAHIRSLSGWDVPAMSETGIRFGKALQLTNILRDIEEDAERGRLYLPRELLEANGIAATDLAEVLRHPALPAVCDALAEIAERRYAEAQAALADCARRPMRPARVMLEVYRRTLARLRARGWTRLGEPVSLPKAEKLWIAFRHGLL